MPSTVISWDGADANWSSDNWDYPDSTTNPGPPPPAASSVELNGGHVKLDVLLNVASIFVDASVLTLNFGQTVSNLTLAGDSSGAVITGFGSITVGTLDMGDKYLGGATTNTIDGFVTLTGNGNIGVATGGNLLGDGSGPGQLGNLSVLSHALLTFDDGAAINSTGIGSLTNDGTIEKLAATDGSSGTSSIGVSIFTDNADGTIQIDAGTLLIDSKFFSINGAVTGGASSILQFDGSGDIGSDFQLANDGTTVGIIGGTTEFLGGIDVQSRDTLELDGGTLEQSDWPTVTIDGTLDLIAGEIVDNAQGVRATPDVMVASDGTLKIESVDLDGIAVVENAGTATITDSVSHGLESSGAVIFNSSTSKFDNTFGGELTLTNSDIGALSVFNFKGLFYNEGTLTSINDQTIEENPSEDNLISVGTFQNFDGTIDVESNTLVVEGNFFSTITGGTLEGDGTLNIVGGQGTVVINADTVNDIQTTSTVATLAFSNGTFEIEQDFIQHGTFVEGNAGLALTDGTDNFDMTVTGLSTLGDNGTLMSGTLLTQGGFTIDGSAGFSISGATLENAGVGTIAGTTLAVSETNSGTAPLAIVQNDASGVITISDVMDNGSTLFGSIAEPGSGSGAEIINAGRIVLEGDAGGSAGAGPSIEVDAILNSGTIEAKTGYVALNDETAGMIGSNGGAGTLKIDSGATLEVGGPVSGNTVLFAAGDSETFVIDDLADNGSGSQQQDFNGTIAGFTQGDTIDVSVFGMGNFSEITGATPESFDAGTDTTTLVLDDGGSVVADLALHGDYRSQTFNVASNPNDDEITVVPCYCRGTLIRTAQGERNVEQLEIGDEVMTMSGAARPIKWIGRRSYDGRFVIGRKDILPVRIKAGAIGDQDPQRDLWISPHHAMYLEGVLIEARDLVNGVSIVQPESAHKVEYFHIELDSHDVIIAEGSLSESFIDDDSRGVFHNLPEYGLLYPEAAQAPMRYYAPRLSGGYEVETARARINDRAGLQANDTSTPSLRGFVDVASSERVAGWAQNPDHPEAPVCLDILVGGQVIGQVLANRYRGDLKRAGIGSGCHSFDFTPPEELAVNTSAIEVRRSLDRARLNVSTATRTVRMSAGAVVA